MAAVAGAIALVGCVVAVSPVLYTAAGYGLASVKGWRIVGESGMVKDANGREVPDSWMKEFCSSAGVMPWMLFFSVPAGVMIIGLGGVVGVLSFGRSR